MTIKKVCVIGSGTMGGGIAQVSAQAGYETTMVDIKQEFVDRGVKMIKASLAKFVEKEKIKQEEMNGTLARLRTSTDIRDAARDADYAIEAVFERAEVKLPIFAQLEESCPKETILASNTSGIPISLLASATRRPEKVIGTHFMNPVPLMKGVEIVKSLLTSEDTLKVSLGFVQSLGKETVVVKDSPGFVTNRIVTLVMNEAAKLLEEDLASIEDIDKIERLSHNWPMGPFELADLVGIDVVVDLLEGIYQQTGWERYKPAPLLKRMVEIGYTGRKAGKGFYQLFGQK
ncbi:MAG: 3-hydroxyacyl-CoA dehydrogenase family protein [Dehalococcoidia bacterium]|nr:MAG: 3-hydroxyacyl-CoA dehydrogenase family protein [Dehalococcoidia bacterium]